MDLSYTLLSCVIHLLLYTAIFVTGARKKKMEYIVDNRSFIPLFLVYLLIHLCLEILLKFRTPGYRCYFFSASTSVRCKILT